MFWITFKGCLLLAVFVANLVSVSKASEIIAPRGSDVILACTLNGTFELPEWQGPLSYAIYSVQGHATLNKAVASINESRLNWHDKNYINLIIRNVTINDAGSYMCIYQGLGYHTVELNVTEPAETDSGQIPDKQRSNIHVVPVVIAVIFWIFICTLSLYIVRRKGKVFCGSLLKPKLISLAALCYCVLGWCYVIYKLYENVKSDSKEGDNKSRKGEDIDNLPLRIEDHVNEEGIEPPKDIKWYRASRSSIFLEWSSPSANSCPGSITGYEVHYIKNESGLADQNNIVKDVHYTETTLINLETCTEYKVSVVACTDSGERSTSETVIVDTKELEMDAFENDPKKGSIFKKVINESMKNCEFKLDLCIQVVLFGNPGDGKAAFSIKLKQNLVCDFPDLNIIINTLDVSRPFPIHLMNKLVRKSNVIYILVVDNLNDLNDDPIDHSVNKKLSTKYSLRDWMTSIEMLLGMNAMQSSIFLVGVFNNLTEPYGNLLSAVEKICNRTTSSQRILQRGFVVDYTNADDKPFLELRNAIENKMKCMYKSTLPTKWIGLEKAIMGIEMESIITLDKVFNEISSDNGFLFADVEEIKTLLRFSHYKGSLIYFDETYLFNFVIRNPEYLLKAFEVCFTLEGTILDDPNVRTWWNKLVNEGMLEIELLHIIWDQHAIFKDYKGMLEQFLQRYYTMSAICGTNENVKKQKHSWYIVPSMLRKHISLNGNSLTSNEKNSYMDIVTLFKSKQSTRVSLVYVFNRPALVPVSYLSLTAAAIKQWPVRAYEDIYLLCNHIGVYEISTHYAGIIYMNGSSIELNLFNLNNDQIDGKVGDKFRRFAEKVMTQETMIIEKHVKLYERFIRCLMGNHGLFEIKTLHSLDHIRDELNALNKLTNYKLTCHNSASHVIPVASALSEWFTDVVQPQTDSSSILTDRDCEQFALSVTGNLEELALSHLRLTNKHVRNIMKEHVHFPAIQLLQMLIEWKTNQPIIATPKALIKILSSCRDVSVDWDLIKNITDPF